MTERTRGTFTEGAPRTGLLAQLEATSSAIMSLANSRAFLAIGLGGLSAGILDGMDAVVSVWLRKITAMRLFQYIASGMLGVQAFRGGWATAALGCAIHFLIATSAAALYYVISFRIPLLQRKPLIYGPIFGLAVYVFMHYIVVPLSAVPPQPEPTVTWVANQLLSHGFFVGLPIALTNKWVASTGTVRR